jgi:SAM-dependent methyltransferase
MWDNRNKPREDFPMQPGQSFLEAVADRLRGQLADGGLATRLGFKGANGAAVVEIGSWDGRYLKLLESLGAKEVFALEPDAAQLQSAVDGGLLDEQHAIAGRVEDVPKEHQGNFDVAFCFNVAPDSTEVDGFIKGIADLVRPGGQVVFTMEEARHNWWPDRLRDVFDVSSEKQFEGSLHQYLVVCTKRT